jgi:RNA polymerase sigma factor (sigma-70 family)
MHELLSAGREAHLLAAAQNGDEAAREELILKNQRLVHSIANRHYYGGAGGDQALEDLIQWGNLGLMRAIELWNGDKAGRFSTYAVQWIRAFIYRNGVLYGSTIRLSYRDSEWLARIRRARADILQRTTREPTSAEIAKAARVPVSFVESVGPLMQPAISLNDEYQFAALSGDEMLEFHEIIADPEPGPEMSAVNRAIVEDVRLAVESLRGVERAVIEWRWLQDPPDTYARIMRKLGLPRKAVLEIERRAVKKLGKRLGVMYE